MSSLLLKLGHSNLKSMSSSSGLGHSIDVQLVIKAGAPLNRLRVEYVQLPESWGIPPRQLVLIDMSSLAGAPIADRNIVQVSWGIPILKLFLVTSLFVAGVGLLVVINL